MNSAPVARRCCALVVAWALLISAVFPAPVLADDEGGCSGEAADSCRSRGGALRLKAVAIASILTAGAVGVCIPIAGKKMSTLRSDGELFFVVKAFAAGVILATGFVHVLPDAFESLNNACLSDNITRFPLAGLFAMVSALATLMVDAMATSYYQKSHFGSAAATAGGGGEGTGEVKNLERVFQDSENGGHGYHETHLHTHSHATHGHAHGSSTVHQDSNAVAAKIRHKIISQVLEAGIIAHSVIIGLSLGTSESPCTIRPLLVALTFHQFFEGMGLGGCIVQAGFKRRSTALMVLFFSITTPLGIAVGIGVSSGYNENSPAALIVEGILNAASAGILIYMALVDLLAADFLNSGLQRRPLLQLFGYTSLLLGAGSMALLAVWA